ncbi:MAG: hypothetical protein L6V35_01070 [Alistipes putredinis]|nr:MAG: hypothetical protein L6V35_01070 [Alistipes putredinis]
MCRRAAILLPAHSGICPRLRVLLRKSGGNYYYKYFLRDYLGNVRDVLSCSKSGGYQEEQFTNYDPLGLAISKNR